MSICLTTVTTTVTVVINKEFSLGLFLLLSSVCFYLCFITHFSRTPTDRRKVVVCVLPLTVTALHGTWYF